MKETYIRKEASFFSFRKKDFSPPNEAFFSPLPIFIHQKHICGRPPVKKRHVFEQRAVFCYGVATLSRLLKIIGLFCKISSLL